MPESKNYDSWNKAKDKLSTDEYNKCRRKNDCIKCGEVGHKFSDCPKPKPLLLESVIIDTTVPITRPHILELPSAIYESCVIKLNSDYPIDKIEHHLKDAFELNKNIGCNIDKSITIIEALTPNLGTVSNEVLIS